MQERSVAAAAAGRLATGLLAGVLTLQGCSSPSSPSGGMTGTAGRTGTGGGAGATSAPGIAGVTTYTVTKEHVNHPVTYAQTPPVGGDHAPVWANCGVYDQSVPNESAVHSLEHGAIWISYRPDLPAGDVARLAALTRARDSGDPDPHVLLSPYPGLPSPVVVTAWATQLQLTSSDDPRLTAFVDRYLRGAQAPEPAAACSGGLGIPVQ